MLKKCVSLLICVAEENVILYLQKSTKLIAQCHFISILLDYITRNILKSEVCVICCHVGI